MQNQNNLLKNEIKEPEIKSCLSQENQESIQRNQARIIRLRQKLAQQCLFAGYSIR